MKRLVTGLAGFAIAALAAVQVGAQPLTTPQNFGIRTMSFELWCQQLQRLSAERCMQRRPEDLKAFNEYRQIVERYELQHLRQVQKDRDLDTLTHDPMSTVFDKSIGIR